MGFLFALCSPGLEGALKDDVLRRAPGLRLAFSRPGVVTFKAAGDVTAEVTRPSPWARAWGVSLGRAEDAATALAALPADARRLHVVAREPEADGAAALVAEVEAALRAADDRFATGAVATADELCADLIVAAGEPWLVGVHRHGRDRSPFPGGAIPIEVPAEAPSRAYAKIEEAIAWADLAVATGQVAVEIGSAPGGASYALARRGVTVWGIDPGIMDPAVLAYVGPGGARVNHVIETLSSVRWEALPRKVDWLLVDVNLAPPVALHGLARMVPAWKHHLRGAVITLKMNDAAMRDGLPIWLDRVRGFGFADVQVTHLPSNRNELCVVARRGTVARPSPSPKPSVKPSAKPSPRPSAKPSAKPSARPSPRPSARPSPKPSPKPSAKPGPKPSAKPAASPKSSPKPKPVRKPKRRPAKV